MAGNNKGNDGIILFLFMVVAVWGLGWFIWRAFSPQLTYALMQVRSAEIAIASIWMNDNDIINVPMPRDTDNDNKRPFARGTEIGTEIRYVKTTFAQWKRFMQTATPDQITGEHIRVLTFVALKPLKYPIAFVLVMMFLWTIYKGPTSKFHRILNLETLMADQAKMFPIIRPFLKFNPNKLKPRPLGSPVPVDLPMFAEALGPEEWLAVNEIPMDGTTPDRTKAEKIFGQQLGPYWKGWQALPNELQVLLAAFCLKASRKRTESDDLLGRLAVCWDHESGIRLSRDSNIKRDARRILRDPKLSEKTLDACKRHAYVSTAMMRGLATAREEGGVLAPSQFVWLRAHNRGLWYPLNNLGRQAFHVEALGVAAHYRAEKQVNRPILKPRVTDAVEGLIEYQANQVIARPIPPVDYGKKGKKTA